jgi:hypothetical protein
VKVRDPQAWSEQLAEFNADESSRKFRDFLVFWVEQADIARAESAVSPVEALGKAFEVAEQTFGYLSVEWLSQMLLVIVNHWVDGPVLWESLSVFERRMVEQATALKLTELQEYAKMSADDQQS